jgi:hypothetical protein
MNEFLSVLILAMRAQFAKVDFIFLTQVSMVLPEKFRRLAVATPLLLFHVKQNTSPNTIQRKRRTPF